jgi:protein O-GlcNAc transferase
MSQGPPKDPRARVGEALSSALRLWQAGRLPEAEAALREILHQMPDQGDALHMLGVIEHQSGRTAAGIALIERALRSNEMSAPFHASVAKLYRAAGDLQKARLPGGRAEASASRCAL